jgi:hypothetical protein
LSDKQLQKNDGADAGKKRLRMRAALGARPSRRTHERPSTDAGDTVRYKKGPAPAAALPARGGGDGESRRLWRSALNPSRERQSTSGAWRAG